MMSILSFLRAWYHRPPIVQVWGDHDFMQVYVALYRPLSYEQQQKLLRKIAGRPGSFIHPSRTVRYVGRVKSLPATYWQYVPCGSVRDYFKLFPNRTVVIMSVHNADQMPYHMYNELLLKLLKSGKITRWQMVLHAMMGELRRLVWINS